MNCEWYTPKKYADTARIVLGEIDLDPFSCEQANKIIKAKKIFTKENSAFDNWDITDNSINTVFMNPPYDRKNINKAVDKFLSWYEFAEGRSGIVFFNNKTETEYGQTLIRKGTSICFLNKRIKFNSIKHLNKNNSPTCGQMFILFSDDTRRIFLFKTLFRWVGTVLTQGK